MVRRVKSLIKGIRSIKTGINNIKSGKRKTSTNTGGYRKVWDIGSAALAKRKHRLSGRNRPST